MVGRNYAARRGIWISLLLVVAGWGCAAAAAATEGGPGWGYNCAEGAPFVWGRLAPAYELCGDGKLQSPIDVSTTGAVRRPLPPPEPAYGSTDLEVVNNGHTVEAEVQAPAAAARLRVGERTYRLVQFHWHTPSEHWLDGERFPVELHMVHADENGRLVLGALVKAGRANAELEKIWKVLPREPGGHAEVHGFDLAKLLPGSLRSYRYPGSLTTPGCDQGIDWVLLAQPVEMSAAQIAAFQELFLGNERFPVGNARPLQPRNGREVVTDAGGPAEALALVDAMIEAHGGMERWAAAPTVSFTDELRPGEAPEGVPMRVTVEQGPRRAYLDVGGTEMRMAWDGERAWSEGWALPMPPRFLALLDYYFLNLPWLASDPGVNLSEIGRAQIPGDLTEYPTVKLTFDPGTGDTPDDYYVLYIDPETHRLKATEYIVTYRAVLGEGQESTPPHLLVYDEWTEVDGLTVPTRYTIYEGEAVYATNRIRDWSFTRPFDLSRMEMPEGAVLDTSTP